MKSVTCCGSVNVRLQVIDELRKHPRKRKNTNLPSRRLRPSSTSELLANSARVDVNGWIIVRARGTPYQVGFQQGSLLANEILDAIEALKLVGEKGYRRNWKFFCETAMNLFWPKLTEEYKEEFQGIVDGVLANKVRNVRLQDIAALNGYFDSVSYHYWLKSKEKAAISRLARAEHCSAFIATGDGTADGKIVLAHNTWFQYLPGARYNAILDVSPVAGKRFIMQTMPGTISSGTDWYLSEAGLVVAETTITGMTTFNPEGSPYFLRARKAIQYAEDVDSWVKIMLDSNNGGYADDWLIGNIRTGEIALLELGTFNHKLERTRNGAFVGSNLATSEEVRSETKMKYDNEGSSCAARQQRLNELIHVNKGKIDSELAKVVLADHRDSYTNMDTPGRNSICGHIESDGRGVPEWEYGPYYPGGCFDGKVTDSSMAERGRFWAHWGRPCDIRFDAETFLRNRPEYEWQRRRLKDVTPYPWTLMAPFSAPDWGARTEPEKDLE